MSEFDVNEFMKRDAEKIERGFRGAASLELLNTQQHKDSKGQPALKELSETGSIGVVPPHPLTLMTDLADNCTWVDHCVRVIGSSAACTTPLFRLELRTAKSYKKKREAEIDKVREILEFPNTHQTGYELFRTIFENLVLYGNAYLQVIKNNKGELHSLYTLPPESIRVIPYLDGEDTLHFAYVQNYNPGGKRVFLEDEMIHFKTSSSKSFVYGKPLFLPQLAEIAANINAVKSVASWFEQGFVGGAIFKMDADPDVAERNRDYIKEFFARPENFGRTLLLEGNMELEDDGNKFKNFNFSDLANTNRDNIIMAAGIPISQAGLRSAAGNANAEVVEAEEKAFIRNTLDMYHKLVYEKINARLMRDILGWKDVVIAPGAMIKFSNTDAIATINCLSAFGVTHNEARDLLSIARVPDEEAGSMFLTQTNNGMLPTARITGIDPVDGSEEETIFDQQHQLAKEAQALKSGASGFGGDAKKVIEGK